MIVRFVMNIPAGRMHYFCEVVADYSPGREARGLEPPEPPEAEPLSVRVLEAETTDGRHYRDRAGLGILRPLADRLAEAAAGPDSLVWEAAEAAREADEAAADAKADADRERLQERRAAGLW